MRSFLLGFLCAAALAGAGYLYLLPRLAPDPCAACGEGTRCEAGRCLVAAPAKPDKAPPKRRTRRARRAEGEAEGEAEAPRVVLKAADLKPETVGDNLKKTEVIDLTESGGATRELDQDAIDAVFRPAQAAIIACLDQARGDAELSGRMTVSYRVRRGGDVGGVRLEAPAYLIKNGLYGCVRPVVTGLRFPASSGAQVVTYPFTLR